jgi:hypothetical protein
MTVFFSDIAKFSTIAESLTPSKPGQNDKSVLFAGIGTDHVA